LNGGDILFLTTLTRVRLPTASVPSLSVSIRRLSAGSRFRRAEHDSDFFPQLVNENRGGLGLVQRAGDLAEGLGHQPRLQADVAVAHLAFDFRLRHQGGNGVDDDDVDRAGADQHVGDLQRLLTGIRLGDQHRVGVDAELLRVVGVERVLRVDERRDTAQLLRLSDGMQRHRSFPAALGSIYFHDPAAGEPTQAERYVQGDRAGRDDLDRNPGLLAQAHHRALAELPLDLLERDLQSLLPVARPLKARLTVCCHDDSLPDFRGLRAPPAPPRSSLRSQFRRSAPTGNPS
jgi:hypothetical protein